MVLPMTSLIWLPLEPVMLSLVGAMVVVVAGVVVVDAPTLLPSTPFVGAGLSLVAAIERWPAWTPHALNASSTASTVARRRMYVNRVGADMALLQPPTGSEGPFQHEPSEIPPKPRTARHDHANRTT